VPSRERGRGLTSGQCQPWAQPACWVSHHAVTCDEQQPRTTGDSFVTPPFSTGVARKDGTEPAIWLYAAIYPAEAAPDVAGTPAP
jgi:hypothetical protein